MDIFRFDDANFISYGFTYLYLLILLLISSFTDFKNQRIPNYLTFPSMITGMIYYFVLDGMAGLMFSAAGLLTGFFLLVTPFLTLYCHWDSLVFLNGMYIESFSFYCFLFFCQLVGECRTIRLNCY